MIIRQKNSFDLHAFVVSKLCSNLSKKNRIKHLNDIGAKRPITFEIECSNCGGHGHNQLTCREHCSHCGVVPSLLIWLKWTIQGESFACNDQTSETIAKLLVDHVIYRHGVPEYSVSDRGTNLLSSLMQEVHEITGIHKLSKQMVWWKASTGHWEWWLLSTLPNMEQTVTSICRTCCSRTVLHNALLFLKFNFCTHGQSCQLTALVECHKLFSDICGSKQP